MKLLQGILTLAPSTREQFSKGALLNIVSLSKSIIAPSFSTWTEDDIALVDWSPVLTAIGVYVMYMHVRFDCESP